MTERLILDLCGGTGSWSKPYAEAGYDVRVVDLPEDVRLLKTATPVQGILAAPRKAPVEAKEFWGWRQLGGKSERTKRLRSMTPPGFARAFFEANP